MSGASATELRLAPPADLAIDAIVRAALAEDLGRAGDITTDAIVGAEQRSVAWFVARRAGRVAGLRCAERAFVALDPRADFAVQRPDGSDVAVGERIARIAGSTRAILAAERTALNLLSRLSGIATATRDAVAQTAGTRASISDTRKTTAGLRALEKYAVRVGGGRNHRFGLDDAVLIKDNHVAAAGSLSIAIARARERIGHLVKIEVEVDTVAQMREALACSVDAILLDNMTPAQLREAVALAGGRVTLEASGSIAPGGVAEVASTGVDIISLGALTHSVVALDIGLDFEA